MSAIILAAGASSRMGQPKQLLPFDGRPLLAHVIEAANRVSSLDEIIVVLGCSAQSIEKAIGDALNLDSSAKVRIVVNPDWETGISSSLKTGIAAAAPAADAACVLLGDQPDVGSAFLEMVVKDFFARSQPALRPVYLRDGEASVPGHPVVISRELWPKINSLGADEGLRSIFEEHPGWLGSLKIESQPLPDVDTPEDYDRLRQRRVTNTDSASGATRR